MIYSGSVAGSIYPFSDPVFGRVSTVRENTVLTGYFSKITDLQAICPCSLAGSGWSRFLPPLSGHGGRKRRWKGALLADNAITSEKLGGNRRFVQVFCF